MLIATAPSSESSSLFLGISVLVHGLLIGVALAVSQWTPQPVEPMRASVGVKYATAPKPPSQTSAQPAATQPTPTRPQPAPQPKPPKPAPEAAPPKPAPAAPKLQETPPPKPAPAPQPEATPPSPSTPQAPAKPTLTAPLALPTLPGATPPASPPGVTPGATPPSTRVGGAGMRPSALPSAGRVQGPPTPPTAPKASNSPIKLPKADPVLPASQQLGTASSGLSAPPAPPTQATPTPAVPATSVKPPSLPTPVIPTLDDPTLPVPVLTPSTEPPALEAPVPRIPVPEASTANTAAAEAPSAPLFNDPAPSTAPAQPPVPAAPLLSGVDTPEGPAVSEGGGGDVLQGVQQRLKLRNAEREYNVQLQKKLKPRTASQTGEFVRVELSISPNGTILKHEITEKNASESFVLAVELAIRNAQLDPLPPELAANPPYVVLVRVE